MQSANPDQSGDRRASRRPPAAVASLCADRDLVGLLQPIARIDDVFALVDVHPRIINLAKRIEKRELDTGSRADLELLDPHRHLNRPLIAIVLIFSSED